MSQEIILQDSNTSLTNPSDSNARNMAFERHGLTDDFVAGLLKHIMDNAVMANPKTGEIMEDFGVKLQAAKAYFKETNGKPDFQIQIANIYPTDKNLL